MTVRTRKRFAGLDMVHAWKIGDVLHISNLPKRCVSVNGVPDHVATLAMPLTLVVRGYIWLVPVGACTCVSM